MSVAALPLENTPASPAVPHARPDSARRQTPWAAAEYARPEPSPGGARDTDCWGPAGRGESPACAPPPVLVCRAPQPKVGQAACAYGRLLVSLRHCHPEAKDSTNGFVTLS